MATIKSYNRFGAVLVLWTALLVACGGGGGSSSSPNVDNKPPSVSGGLVAAPSSASLIVIPSVEGFTITLNNYPSFVKATNVTGIVITARGADGTRTMLSLNTTTLEAMEGSFIWADLTSGQDYHFSINLLDQDGSPSNRSLPLDFMRSDNRRDHDGDGIYLGPNRDGDGQADAADDAADGDLDNDGIVNGMDDCRGGTTDWESNSMEDTDGDGCRDADEDRVLVGVTDLRAVVAARHIDLSWTNPSVAMASIEVRWWRSADSPMEEVFSASPFPTSYRLANLAADVAWTVELGVTYSNGGKSVVVRRSGLFVGGDGDGDGIVDGQDNCAGVANGDQRDTDKDGAGDVCDGDIDGDDVTNTADIDRDGDGLIEIATAAELDAVRWQLDGGGRRLSEGGELNMTGCGGSVAAGNISRCLGYELVADIDISGEGDGAAGWLPLGRDDTAATQVSADECSSGSSFSGIFDGNDKTIGGLAINRPADNCVGLFSRVSSTAEIRSVHLEAGRIVGKNSVGSLVGKADSARLLSSSVIFERIEGHRRVGGLVGRAERGYLASVVAWGGSVVGSSFKIGGLVGEGPGSSVHGAEVRIANISGTMMVGGLLGHGGRSDIFSSAVLASAIDGERWIGGLVGHMDATGAGVPQAPRIIASFVVVDSLSASGRVDSKESGFFSEAGGLVGNGNSTLVIASYGFVGNVSGAGAGIGDLMGEADEIEVAYSYMVSGAGLNRTGIGRLVGKDRLDRNIATVLHGVYWDRMVNISSSRGLSVEAVRGRLRSPMDYSDIYSDWATEVNAEGDSRKSDIETGIRNTLISGMADGVSVYCDLDQDGRIMDYERREDNRIWDFGSTEEYPAIRCTRDGGRGQRGWYQFDEMANPMINPAVFAIGQDSDGDGYNDIRDIFPLDGKEWSDEDKDGWGDHSDNCPLFANTDQADIDGDGLGDVCDADADNDGYLNEEDAFPLDIADWQDRDNDSVGDIRDNCAEEKNPDQLDTDGDNMGDACDDDRDNDGFANGEDAFPLNIDEWEDEDNDSVGDNSDNCRGRINRNQTDTDRDGLGDACDGDKDNDGIANADELPGCALLADCDDDNYPDLVDLFPLNPNLWSDIDRDGIGDHIDKCPLVAGRDQRDTDNDGDGDLCDRDDDGDGYPDMLDVDDDGDGLIEIATAAGLDAVRYALDGRGIRTSAGGSLNSLGCGGIGGIDNCSGYELVRDIDLTDFGAGKGWQPLGRGGLNGTDNVCNGGEPFSATFEGNDWTVRGLLINRSDENCVGLFGWVAAGNEINRLHIEAKMIEGHDYVGGLVGHGDGVRITDASVVFDRISGRREVGGLIGSGERMHLVSSSALGNIIKGSAHGIGGLVGHAPAAVVRFSEARLGNLSGTTAIGGLVGSGQGIDIMSSSVLLAGIHGEQRIGGLIGDGESTAPQGAGLTRVIASFAMADRLFGSGRNSLSDVGGLIGRGNGSVIVGSYVVARVIDGGGSHIGGLLGGGANSEVAYTYVISDDITGSDVTRALLGGGVADVFSNSYWDINVSGIDDPNSERDKTTAALRLPTEYSAIYDTWNSGVNTHGAATTSDQGLLNGTEDAISIYCDRDQDGRISAAERQASNHIWDFGTNTSYPVIRCTRDRGLGQRSWWWVDNDNDIQFNHSFLALDLDRDGDGHLDIRDLFPLDSDENTDGDRDGIADNKDNCPLDLNPDQADGDEDELGDACDTDWDNDGVGNEDEAAGCELLVDCDSDSYNDGVDAFPTDADEWQDTDGDRVGNIGDNCPLVANMDQADLEGDGLGDACDDDKDGDNYTNDDDAFPLDSSEWLDPDGDRVGSNADNCPLVANVDQADLEGDGLGDVCDPDNDNDGYDNSIDIDDDGDGLIEVVTAEEVDMMRWVTDGSGRRRSFTDDSLNTTGCGSSALAENITACNGYELTQSIDMFDYINNTYGDDGWVPVGGTWYFVSTNPDDDGAVNLNGVCQDTGIGHGGGLVDIRFSGVFEGNGHVISGLYTDRTWPDCGGFFGILSGEVRNLGVLIDKIEVSTENGLGGLVADARGARIISSYAISRALIGVSDDEFIGGLVGIGSNAEIIDSYAVTGLLEMRNGRGGGVNPDEPVAAIGGLVGHGKGATIISSYAITDAMIGSRPVGETETYLSGLVGFDSAKIISSYAVAGSMSGAQYASGFTDTDDDIYYSYAVSGHLASVETSSSIDWVTAFTRFKEKNADVKTHHSYWDINTSEVTVTVSGTSKTTPELQTPTDFSGIYENWDDGFDLDGVGGADDRTIYCDEDGSGSIEADEKRDNSHSDGDNRIWDFGSSTEYPAIRCTPDTPADQRAWWYINSTTNHPQLNRNRLNQVLGGP